MGLWLWDVKVVVKVGVLGNGDSYSSFGLWNAKVVKVVKIVKVWVWGIYGQANP